MTDGKIIPLPGGLPVHDDDGEIVAAVSAAVKASGEYEACIRNAIESLKFKLSSQTRP